MLQRYCKINVIVFFSFLILVALCFHKGAIVGLFVYTSLFSQNSCMAQYRYIMYKFC